MRPARTNRIGSAAALLPAVRRAAGWAVAVYLVVLALIALWPTPVDRGARGSIVGGLDWLHAHGVPAWLDYPVVEFTANIALFLPVGLLGVLLLGRSRWWLTILAGAATSMVIEASQLIFLPARVATAADVVANTAGTVLGAVVGVVLLAAITARPAASLPPGG